MTIETKDIYSTQGNKIGQQYIYKLDLEGKEISNIILVHSTVKSIESIELINFSENELNQIAKYHVSKRKMQYILGRYAMKTAVNNLISHNNMIEIGYGLLGYPIVSRTNQAIEITLSHCENEAIAIAFNKDIMLGIDIEKINIERQDVLEKVTTNREHIINEKINLPSITFMTLIWTAKEALSKAIKTGFTVDMEIFQVKNIFEKGGVYYIDFLYFPTFSAIGKVVKDKIVTIAYVKKIDMSNYVLNVNYQMESTDNYLINY
ncbi:MAG: 4'-phosphopantetheinyl transferase superfamily protein [Vallitalea sp.]|nr:4'-phosphopantetheinyl transferase superfamily protein [Vallitalea sp.]